jgi:hypothetical protein
VRIKIETAAEQWLQAPVQAVLNQWTRLGLARGKSSERAVLMSVFDLIKATVACGASAFLIYSFPVIGQVLIIAVLSLLWLSYAHRTLAKLLRR